MQHNYQIGKPKPHGEDKELLQSLHIFAIHLFATFLFFAASAVRTQGVFLPHSDPSNSN
jgi:hypothetical protein